MIHLTLEEFGRQVSKKKAVLVLYKDKILDLTQFVRQHPGGSNAIYKMVGIEISSLLFEEGIIRHKHSRKIIPKLMEYQIGDIIDGTFGKEEQEVDHNVLTMFKSLAREKSKPNKDKSEKHLEKQKSHHSEDAEDAEQMKIGRVPLFFAKPSLF